MHRNRKTMHSSFHGHRSQQPGSRARALYVRRTTSRNMAAIWAAMHCQLIFDITHTCYVQLTAVKTRFPLTSII